MRKKIASDDGRFLGEHSLEVLPMRPGRVGFVALHHAESSTMHTGHRHCQWEMNLVVRGWARYLLERRCVHLSTGAANWLLPQQPHRLIERSGDLRMWIVVFEPSIARQLARDEDFSPWRRWLRSGRPDDCVERVIDPDSARRIADLCQRVQRYQLGPRAEAAGLAWVVADAWRACLASDNVPAGEHLHPAVEQAARLVHDHPEWTNLNTLAGKCCVSRAHLSRLFRQHLGMTITDFRNRQRVDRFLSLYDSRTKATQAAFAAGFGSYTQAFRVVRQLTGSGPLTLRRKT